MRRTIVSVPSCVAALKPRSSFLLTAGLVTAVLLFCVLPLNVCAGSTIGKGSPPGRADAAPAFSDIMSPGAPSKGTISQRANETADPEAFAIRMNQGKAIMACKLQALEGTVHGRGLKIRSTSTSDGGGEFSLELASVGRGGNTLDVSRDDGHVSTQGRFVQLSRSSVTEEFSTSVDGIRQDFLIPRRPSGNGPLVLDVAVSGATASGSGASLPIELPSGRKLVYAQLRVTDASGTTVPAEMAAKSPETIRITVTDTGAVYPLHIDPTISDADWFIVNPGLPGTDGVVYAVVCRSGSLYVGGNFSVAGDVSANRIAKWDGSVWTTLGSGMDSDVSALAFDSSGNLYAGGSFTTAGGNSANRIAKWDGSAWSALGSGITSSYSSVHALAFDSSGNLYAGGFFSTAGGISASSIAKWDGSAWSALGSGMNSYSSVYALAFDSSGNLYAGGNFTTAGSGSANRIAKWNGSAWSALGSGITSSYSSVHALAFDSSGNLYAGGDFTTAGGNSANRIAKWDGSAWTTLGPGMDSDVNALAFGSSGNLYAGGYFMATGSVSAYRIAKWDGSDWSPLGSGIDSIIYALACDSSGNLYAGGYFTTTGSVSANCIAKWNGSTWSALGSGITSSYSCVSALAFDSSGNLYAGGNFTTAGSGSANRIAKWNGSAWSALGSGMDSDVNTLAFDSSGNLYAGGIFNAAGGVSANYIAKWNGSTWSALGSGMDSDVNALAFDSSGNLYAGGYFTTAGGNSANYIAKWNGSAWSALGSGMDSRVNALAADSAGNLYAGGCFYTAGGVSASCIAKWNGSTWSALGSGTDSLIYALSVDASGNVYAGGWFTDAGGVAAGRIAKWNGQVWSVLGSGVNGYSVSALAFDSAGNLYAGGSFTIAGDHVSPYLAMCGLPYRIGGTVSGATGVTMTLSGAASKTDTTITDGTFSFAGLENGAYTITPSKTGYVFSPSSRNVNVSGDNVTGMDFAVNAAPIITESDPQPVTCDMNNTPTAFSLTLHATDADANTITWSISTAAGHGTASASGTGTSKAIGYTPTTNWHGSDSFTVQVADGNGGTDTINVNVTVTDTDSDDDGLPDAWEMQYFGNLAQGPNGDPDSDGLTNLQEYQAGTDPTNADTDGDGLKDGWEVAHNLDPLHGGTTVVAEDWVETYDGTAEGPDYAVKTVVDAGTGHILVTGHSWNSGQTASAIVTVAYSTTGTQLWAASFDNQTYPRCFASGLAVNATTGNVYVTGWMTTADQTSGQIVTIAYSSTGTELWTATYAETAYPHASAAGVAVNPSTGLVVVTGDCAASDWSESKIVTRAYNSSGTAQWTATRYSTGNPLNSAFGIALDPATGNVHVAGQTTTSDYTLTSMLTIVYSSTGTEVWASEYSSTTYPVNCPAAVVVDSESGNTYVTGYRTDDEWSAVDLVTVAYDADGEQLWDAVYASEEYEESYSADIALSPQTGAVYVTGYSTDSAWTESEMVTLAYSASGTGLWTETYAVASHPQNAATALAVNPTSGNIYVTGASTDANDVSHMLTLAYDLAGNRLWEQTHSGSGTGNAQGMDVAVGPAGALYVTGYAYGDSNDFCTVKYTEQVVADSDNDGLPDEWERYYFGNLSHTATQDGDNDGLTNLQEYQHGTNPTSSDTDSDGMPDGWEVNNGLDPLTSDATGDPDGDGVDNLTEYLQGRNPQKGAVADTNGAVALKVFTVLE